MGGLTEERRRQLSHAGRLGALTLWTRHPDRIPDVTAAQQAFTVSFHSGHGGDPREYDHLQRRERPVGLCRVCPMRVVIPTDWDDDRKDAAAALLRSRHYERLAALAVAKRRATG
jgi:hypothetical protein